MKDLAQAILEMPEDWQSRPVGIMDPEVGECDPWWGYFGEAEEWIFLSYELPEEVWRVRVAIEAAAERRASEERRAAQIKAVPEEMRRFLPLCQ
jgi:hypothetical protein